MNVTELLTRFPNAAKTAAEYLPQPEQSPKPASGLAYIPSWLDDMPLSPVEFRLYCHIRRVGRCYQTVRTMAKACRVHPDSLWPALNVLQTCKLIHRERRPGQTTLLRALGNPLESKGRVKQPTHRKARGDTHRKARGAHPLESKGCKGNPSKGSPTKGQTPPADMADWQVEKDIARLRLEIAQQEDRPDRNRDAMRQKRARLKDLETEQARRAPPPKPKAPPATTRATAPTSKPEQFGGVTEARWKELVKQVKEAVTV